MLNQNLFYFNGLRAETGNYLIGPLAPQDLVAVARGEKVDPARLRELQWFDRRRKVAHLGPIEGVDPKNLAQAGWGVVFASGVGPDVRAALEPLLRLRAREAGRLYREYFGTAGHEPGQTKERFLAEKGAAPGPVDPKYVPYYLLLVGDPEAISYRFQYELDVQYAVGRVWFENSDGTPDLAAFARYAESVIAAEKTPPAPKRMAWFGTDIPDDAATQLSAQQLVKPLAKWAGSLKTQGDAAGWEVSATVGPTATKDRLGQLLGGPETPALLFAATHGLGFDLESSRQRADQGALLCQDFPGMREWYRMSGNTRPVDPEFYFAASDVKDDARLLGLIAFFYACFGAGTPQFDNYAISRRAADATVGPLKALGTADRLRLADRAFVARLPQRLLSHEAGGALAVVGHVDLGVASTFQWREAGTQLQVFEAALRRLLEGHPIGSAFDFFNERSAEITTMLNGELEEIRFGKPVTEKMSWDVAYLWAANADARGFIILGDPAVRLQVTIQNGSVDDRPILAPINRMSFEPPQVADRKQADPIDLVAFLNAIGRALVGMFLHPAGPNQAGLSLVTARSEELEISTYTNNSPATGEHPDMHILVARTRVPVEGPPEQVLRLDTYSELISSHDFVVSDVKRRQFELLARVTNTGT